MADGKGNPLQKSDFDALKTHKKAVIREVWLTDKSI